MVGDVQRDLGVGKPVEQAHESQQLEAEILERSTRLVLVLEGSGEPEERHGRRVRINLDGAASAP